MKVGSLFSGYGGLDMAVCEYFGANVAWHVEYDKAPSRILAHHFPDIDNYGDVRSLDFATVEPVDILTGGYPCQPFSHAGLRKGKHDERHLWPEVLRAIREMGPRLVVLENVRGHLSLGFADVLADLAGVGMSAQWGIVRASDAGACHQRARLFIVAYPSGRQFAGLAKQHDGLQLACECGGGDATDAGCKCGFVPTAGRLSAVTMPRGDGATRRVLTAADTCCERHGRGQDAGVVGRVGTASAVVGWQASAAREITGDRGPADVADADITSSEARRDAGHDSESVWSQSLGLADIAWGDYAAAIDRWEHVIGRPAPAPTEPGPKGGPRLSPAFVEWMMGLPVGWVTDPAIGISRAAQLKALGNGVVPQQAYLALSHLMVAVAA